MEKGKIFVNGKLRNYDEYEPNLQGRTMPLYVRIKKPIVDSYTLYYDWNVGWRSTRNCKYHFKDKKTNSPAFFSFRDGIHVKKVGEITFPTKEQYKKVLIFNYMWGQTYWVGGRDGSVHTNPMPNDVKIFVDVESKLLRGVWADETQEIYRLKKPLLAVFRDYGVKIKKTRLTSKNYWGEDKIKLKIEIDYTLCIDVNGFLKSIGDFDSELQKLIVSKLKEKRMQGYE